MKKFLSVLISLGFIFVASICYAQEVRVSDYGIDNFISEYNKISKSGVKINSKPKLAEKVEIAGYRYHSYYIEVGSSEDPVNVVLLATLDGYVSKIMLFGYLTENFAKVSTAMMVTLGLNQTEYDDFIDSLQNNPYDKTVWCSAKNRYINYKLNKHDKGVYIVVLSAYTN